MDPCPNCDTQDSDPHEPGECLLGSPSPGDVYRRTGFPWKENAPADPAPGRVVPLDELGGDHSG